MSQTIQNKPTSIANLVRKLSKEFEDKVQCAPHIQVRHRGDGLIFIRLSVGSGMHLKYSSFLYRRISLNKTGSWYYDCLQRKNTNLPVL